MSTVGYWESRRLGADERFVERVSPEQEALIDAAAGITRERILERALQRAQAFIQDTDLHREGQMKESDTKRILREIHVALATPPARQRSHER